MVPMKPLTCSGPEELLHVDFTSIEEKCLLRKNLLSRMCWVYKITSPNYVVAYVLKTDCTYHC